MKMSVSETVEQKNLKNVWGASQFCCVQHNQINLTVMIVFMISHILFECCTGGQNS